MCLMADAAASRLLLALLYRVRPAITRTSGLGISYRADDPLPPPGESAFHHAFHSDR